MSPLSVGGLRFVEEKHADRLGNTGWLLLAFDFDPNLRSQVQCTAPLACLKDRRPRADTAAVWHHRIETHLVAAEVKRPGQVFYLDEVAGKSWNQRQSEVTMRDGSSVGQLPDRALLIHMNPLKIVRSFSESVDPLLVDRDPVGYADFLTFQGASFLN